MDKAPVLQGWTLPWGIECQGVMWTRDKTESKPKTTQMATNKWMDKEVRVHPDSWKPTRNKRNESLICMTMWVGLWHCAEWKRPDTVEHGFPVHKTLGGTWRRAGWWSPGAGVGLARSAVELLGVAVLCVRTSGASLDRYGFRIVGIKLCT